MNRTTAKNIQTVAVCLALTATVPPAIYFAFTALMSRFITRDNAGIVFDQFQKALDAGNIVNDSAAASDVATTAYWKKTQAIPLDGWGHQVRISAVVQKNNCRMKILSAGSDGAFGTSDDVAIERSFDLAARSPKTEAASLR
jgi:hypothetical protein